MGVVFLMQMVVLVVLTQHAGCPCPDTNRCPCPDTDGHAGGGCGVSALSSPSVLKSMLSGVSGMWYGVSVLLPPSVLNPCCLIQPEVIEGVLFFVNCASLCCLVHKFWCRWEMLCFGKCKVCIFVLITTCCSHQGKSHTGCCFCKFCSLRSLTTCCSKVQAISVNWHLHIAHFCVAVTVVKVI